MNGPEKLVFASVEELQRAAAERIAAVIERAVADRGRCTLALAGGRTPLGAYALMARSPLREAIHWPSVHVIWGDERYVPFHDPESNYGAARETLLDHVPVTSEHIYPVPTYYADPAEAAAIYDRQVAALLEAGGGRLDLAILGIGPDGHTASLFPDHPGLAAPAGQLAVAIDGSPKPPPRRVTLTLEALSRARAALFLVTGADKAPAVARILAGDEALPAARVRPAAGSVTWMLDGAAAATS